MAFAVQVHVEIKGQVLSHLAFPNDRWLVAHEAKMHHKDAQLQLN
jgi:hypothetical protein